jgi:serine phosphatase RsbU (regulator of sigma subunit)
LAIEATIALVDIRLPGMSLGSLLIVGPLLAATRLTARATIAFTFLAAMLAVVVGTVDGTLGATDHALQGISVAVGGGFAILTARMRTERDSALAHITHIAELTQRAILRPIPPVIGGVAFAAYYQSATHRALMGGDLYDTALTPSGLRLIVGDVKGKGLDAVHLAAAVLGRFREIAYVEPDLVRLARQLDTCVSAELGAEDFVTILLAEFVPGEVRLVNCGHHPPLRAGRQLDILAPPTSAPPLGLHPEPVLQRVRLAANERLLIYTDGLVEARDADRVMFPLDHHVTSALTTPALDEALGAVQRLVLEHTGNNLRDDLVLILAQPVFDRTAGDSAGNRAGTTHDVPKPRGEAPGACRDRG